MAEKTRSSILVSIIKDIMKDGKERTLAEIRKEIQSRQNLVYEKRLYRGRFFRCYTKHETFRTIIQNRIRMLRI